MMRWTVAKPMPVPGEFLYRVQALERAEKFVHESHVKARTVCRAQNRLILAFALSLSELDPGVALLFFACFNKTFFQHF